VLLKTENQQIYKTCLPLLWYIHAKLFLLNVAGIKNFSPTHYFSSSSTLVRGTAEIIPSYQQGVNFL